MVTAQRLLADKVREILSLVGEDPDREGLLDTPARVARAYGELLSGYAMDAGQMIRDFSTDGYDNLVLVKNIPFTSLCEHHMLPFSGVAHIGYIPNGRLLGLSKLPRILEVYARRLQVQERLTDQVADALAEHLKPLGTICVLSAAHSCMSMRGAKASGTTTVTSALRGVFLEDRAARAEVMGLINAA